MLPESRQTPAVWGQLRDQPEQPEHFVLSKKFPSSRETCLVVSHRGNSWTRTDVHFRDFCTPAATACPPQIPLNGWARDTTKEKVCRLNLWLKRNMQSMFSDPKQTQRMGKNARQDAGMSPRLTSSCCRLSSPSTRLTRKHCFSGLRCHTMPTVFQTRQPRMTAIWVCVTRPHPFNLIQKAKERRYLNEICDTQSGF